MESDRDFCCWQDLYIFPTRSTKRLGTPTHGGKVIITSLGWQLFTHQVWDLLANYSTRSPCTLCLTQNSVNVRRTGHYSGYWVHHLVHSYSLISIFMRKVYSMRQTITLLKSTPPIFSWGKKWQCSNNHNWRQSGKRGTVTHRTNNNCTEEQWKNSICTS